MPTDSRCAKRTQGIGFFTATVAGRDRYLEYNLCPQYESLVLYGVRGLYFLMSIGSERPSPGNKLQNLCYEPSSLLQKSAYFMAYIVTPYLSEAVEYYMLNNEWMASANVHSDITILFIFPNVALC